MAGAWQSRPARVFISSARGGLAPYRTAAIEVVRRLGLVAVCMEDFSPERLPPPEVCRREVESSDVLVLLLGRRYGSRPPGSDYSYTELEYRWAVAGDAIEVLPFVIDPSYLLPETDAEEAGGEAALASFADTVKSRHITGSLGDIAKFREELIIALHRFEQAPRPFYGGFYGQRSSHEVPRPPAMHAVPPYVGNAPFTGRATQLLALDSWARSADPMMVIEAIGGNGKSALTWEWAVKQAEESMPGLAGRLWWSFYDGSASMKRFLQEALAYTTNRPVYEDVDRFGRKHGQRPTSELSFSELCKQLTIALEERPFLLVLDGFERLLSAYHKFDPTKLYDDDIVQSKRSLIEPQAFDALRMLTSVEPSKVLVSTRLMPDALGGRFGILAPGVAHVRLPGLTDHDTVGLLARLGVHGTPEAIRPFFGSLGNHPLLVGIVAGLIHDYRPQPGSFDDWRADPAAGAAFAVPHLDLKQRRSHILAAALNGLDPAHRSLLGWISALPGSVDWQTLLSINPFSDGLDWSGRGPAGSTTARLDLALKDLEDRGLLWWDRDSNSYDLHPIVRAVADRRLDRQDRMRANDQIASHFEAIPAAPGQQRVHSVDDLQNTITLFRSLVAAERGLEAERVWLTRLRGPLLAELGAATTAVELLEPFAEWGWKHQIELGIALTQAQRVDEAIMQYEHALSRVLHSGSPSDILLPVLNLVDGHLQLRQLARAKQYLDYADSELDARQHYGAWLLKAILAAQRGLVREAHDNIRQASARYGRGRDRNAWFESGIRYWPLYLDFRSGRALSRARLRTADEQAGTATERRALAQLRRDIYIRQGQFQPALELAHECDRMDRDAGIETAPAAVAYLYAALRDRQPATAAVEETLDRLPRILDALRPHYHLSLALRELGRTDEALFHAQRAHQLALGEGGSYSQHWELQDASRLLASLGSQPARWTE